MLSLPIQGGLTRAGLIQGSTTELGISSSRVGLSSVCGEHDVVADPGDVQWVRPALWRTVLQRQAIGRKVHRLHGTGREVLSKRSTSDL